MIVGQAVLARHARRRDELAPRRWRKLVRTLIIAACVTPAMLVVAKAIGERVAPCRFHCCLPPSPLESTQVQLHRLAYEGFPMWQAQHDDTRCPTIRELTEQVSSDPSNVRDSWHQPIEIRCGEPLPQGAHSILLRSAGPDGMFGTDDDLTSAD